MNFEEALVYELETISGLENKVFPQTAKEGTEPPFVVYNSSEGEEIMTLDGGTNIFELTAEIGVVGRTYDEMKTFTRSVLDKLASFYGRRIGINGPSILSLGYGEPIESYDEQMEYHRSSIEVRVKL